MKKRLLKSKSHWALSILALFLFSVQVSAQTTVNGKILDSDGLELFGASVLVKGTSSGTVSEMDGTYKLDVPAGSTTLVFSYTGFATQEIEINGRSIIDLVLESASELLDEIVVVGYGRQKKSVVTGAISSIDMDDIESLSTGALESSLQGRTAGVTILPNSGAPGAGFKVRIRGTGSNGNSDPLYIVDGMRTRDISFISINEIQSMEVLKDAASTAIYGAEGANGVIIVTTKSGNEKNAGLTYDVQFGRQAYAGNLELMSAEQHAQYMVDAGIGGRVPGDVTNNTNWLDEVFEAAPLQKHSLSFTGGNEKLNYFLMGSYFDQDGIVVGDNDRFNRISTRANINSKVNNWLNVGARMNYTHSTQQGIAEDSEFGGVLGNAILMDPNTPVTYGATLPQFAKDLQSNGTTLFTNSDGAVYGLSDFVTGEIYNPLGAIDLVRGAGNTTDRFIGSAFADITIMEGLTFTTRFGVDNRSGNYHNWTPSFYFTETRQSNNASVQQNHWRTSDFQWENYATYTLEFGESDITLLAGTSAFKSANTWVNTAGTGLIKENDLFGYLGSVQPGVAFTNANGGASERTLASYFGRITYDYADKYLLTATLRRDGSSLLAEGQKWGTFPSVSAGWVMSREDFFNEGGILNFVKLRASWGQNGSLSNLDPGAWQTAIGFGGAYPDANGNLQVTASPTILSNPELTWETSEQLDFGIDLGFFQDKLTITADYFDKQTKDLLNGGVIPALVGNNAPTVNLGDISNKGFEFEAEYRNKAGALTYNVAGNFTMLKNEVTRLDENLDFAGGTGVGVGWTATAFEEGLPAWYFRGYETNGILQNGSDVTSYADAFGLYDADGNATVQAGDPRVVDTNGDGEITPDDQTFIGSPHPDLIYGVRLGAQIKGFDFAFFLQGVVGNDILLGYNRTDRQTSNKPAFFSEDSWSESNPTNDWFRPNGDNIYAYNSDYMVFDGTYARIKQIQLGYNFTPELLSFTRGGRIYVSLEDIMTFTKYQGLDPETGSGNDNSLGIDRGVYPIPSKILIGLSISL